MGMYGSQIALKLFFPNKLLWSKLREFKKCGLIIPEFKKNKIPKFYKLTEKGEIILSSLIPPTDTKERIEKKFPEGIIKFSIHKLRYKQGLVTKPSWIYSTLIGIERRYNGIIIKRTSLKNWDKFYLYFRNSNQYGGIHNIEVCNNWLIYNFRRKKEDSIVESSTGLDTFLQNRVDDCKRLGEHLSNLGFELDPMEPIEAQKPHWVIETEDGCKYNDIGKFIELHIKDAQGTLIQDHSPPSSDPHTETDSKEKVKNVFEQGNRIDQLSKDMKEVKENISKMTDAMGDMASSIKGLVELLRPQAPDSAVEGNNQNNMFS